MLKQVQKKIIETSISNDLSLKTLNNIECNEYKIFPPVL